jgi:hypothetical protein
VKILVDHNISPHIARALAVLAAVEGHRVRALSDDFDPATPDTEWLRRLGEEGGWVVISGDRRIIRNPQEHTAWLRARVITFFLERGWHRGMSQFVFAGRLMMRWPDLIEVAERFGPPAAFVLPLRGKLRQLPAPGTRQRR